MVFLFQHLGPGRYNGPEIAAQALATNFDAKSRERVRILDVAAGTGRLGAEVYTLRKIKQQNLSYATTQKKTKIGFQDYRLMQAKRFAERPKGAFCNTLDMH